MILLEAIPTIWSQMNSGICFFFNPSLRIRVKWSDKIKKIFKFAPIGVFCQLECTTCLDKAAREEQFIIFLLFHSAGDDENDKNKAKNETNIKKTTKLKLKN